MTNSSHSRDGQISPQESLLENEWDDLLARAILGLANVDACVVVTTASERLRRKATQVVCGDEATDLLDDELVYDAETDDGLDSRLVELPRFRSFAGAGSTSSDELVLKAKMQVGRASVYRPRRVYIFEPDLDPDDPHGANRRGRDANFRKARRAAADEALANDCTVWVTLTVDDLHGDVDCHFEVRRFLRRLRDRYRIANSASLKYVGVIGCDPDVRPHFHVLLSHDVDPEDVRECWRLGSEVFVVVIDRDEIEQKVNYMSEHVRDQRVTFGRFIRSRSGSDDLDLPVDGVAEARELLEDLVYPHAVRVTHSQPFGAHPNVAFRFSPQRNEE